MLTCYCCCDPFIPGSFLHARFTFQIIYHPALDAKCELTDILGLLLDFREQLMAFHKSTCVCMGKSLEGKRSYRQKTAVFATIIPY